VLAGGGDGLDEFLVDGIDDREQGKKELKKTD